MTVELHVYRGSEALGRLSRWEEFALGLAGDSLSRHPRWLKVLEQGFGHEACGIEATEAGVTRGLLPLALVQSRLFGRFLVGLPYLSVGGVHSDDAAVGGRLVDAAVDLADRLDVKYLELRHEQAIAHPRLSQGYANKVHMRLGLPASSEQLWKDLSAKVRNQVRKGQQADLAVRWGHSAEELEAFYDVFARNMRDLGTPVFGRALFQSVLEQFPGEAELCVVRAGATPVAGALLTHGRSTTEVPSASALRAFNHTNCNMLMYWHLLQRAVERGQRVFDFGRSTADGSVYRFKKQWGADPSPAVWQSYVRRGDPGEMRLDHPKHRMRIWAWQRMPLWLTRWLGPKIVRGIP